MRQSRFLRGTKLAQTSCAALAACAITLLVSCKGTPVEPKHLPIGQLPESKRPQMEADFAQAQGNLYHTGAGRSVLPSQAPLGSAQRQRLIAARDQALLALSPGSSLPTDPPICLDAGKTDTLAPAKNIGDSTFLTVYPFTSQPHVQDMYAQLLVSLDICTTQTLSSKDEGRWMRVLNGFGITNAGTLTAAFTVTGLSLGGVVYPQIVPFSYSYDQKGPKSYNIATTTLSSTPWQPTSSFGIEWSMKRTNTLSINTADLFSSVAADVAGQGPTSILAPANGYVQAAKAIAIDLSNTLSGSDSGSDKHTLLLNGSNPERVLTYRFNDQKNQPLAGVRLVVQFTNSLAKMDTIDPSSDDSAHIPQFQDGSLPPIMSITVAGAGTASETLLQQVAKDQNYQTLIAATSKMNPSDFAKACDLFEQDLGVSFGLNKYDAALVMAYVLQENGLYLASKDFYSSGCFVHNNNGRALMHAMGITLFDKGP